MIPSAYYYSLADDKEIGGVAMSAIARDPLAMAAVMDWIEEQGDNMKPPFEVGKCYLIETVTLYYVGRCVSADLAWVELSDAPMTHRTGRLSVLIRHQSFTHPELEGRQRVEPCGTKIVSLNAVVSFSQWTGDLPKKAIP